MKSILMGIGAMIAISAIAWGISETQETPSSAAFSSASSVRLD